MEPQSQEIVDMEQQSQEQVPPSSPSSSSRREAAAVAECILFVKKHGLELCRLPKSVDKDRMSKRPKITKPLPVYKEDLAKSHKQQTKEHVEIALDHYNATTKGPKYELLESFDSNAFYTLGLHIHVCFLAKPIADVDNADTSPKHFFAEVVYLPRVDRKMTIFCCIVDPNCPDTRDGCGSCPPKRNLYHPKGGFVAGDYPFVDSSFPMPDHFYDKDVPEERRIRMSA